MLSFRRNIFLLCLPLLMAFKLGKHDFHTSLTEMRYNSGTNSYEITIRVFTDDLKSALEKANPNVKIDLSNDSSKSLIDQYFKKHFAFVKEKDVRFAKYLGNEVEVDATWLYLELPNGNELVNYSILNSIFTELFDDQSNLLNILHGEKRHTLIFSKDSKLQMHPL